MTDKKNFINVFYSLLEAIKRFSDDDAHDDAALKCYMNCIFHELDIVDDNGEVHYDKLKAFIPDVLRDYVFQLVVDCESHIPVGETQCDRAWSWHLCWKKMDSKVRKYTYIYSTNKNFIVFTALLFNLVNDV